MINKTTLASALVAASGLYAGAGVAHIVVDGIDPDPRLSDNVKGGVNYHVRYTVHHADGNVYSAKTGDVLSGIDGDVSVGTVKSRAWSDPAITIPDGFGDASGDQAGWGHSAKWALIDFSKLFAGHSGMGGGSDGPAAYKISVELTSYNDGDADSADDNLAPGMTAWMGQDAGDDGHKHWFPNGTESPEVAAGDWWAEDLGMNIGYATADENGTATITKTIARHDSHDPMGMMGGSYWTIAFGGNNALGDGGAHDENFKLNVSVSAVPVPAAVYLFGSSIIGLIAAGRRKPSA